MRVTKLIREYVEKTVNEKLPLPEQTPDPIKEEHEQLLETLQQHCKTVMADFARKYAGEFSYNWSGYSMDNTEMQVQYAMRNMETRGCSAITTKQSQDYDAKCKEIRAMRAATIENILVTLELGGSKADLDAMLANL